MKAKRVLACVLMCILLSGQMVYAQDGGQKQEVVQEEAEEQNVEGVDKEVQEVTKEEMDSEADEKSNEIEESGESDISEDEASLESEESEQDFSGDPIEMYEMVQNAAVSNVPQVYSANVILNGLNGDPADSWYSIFNGMQKPEYYELTDYLLENNVLCWTTNFWNAAFNSDFQKNPNYFYEVVLMGFLKHEQELMSMEGVWDSKEMGLSLSIYSELVDKYVGSYEQKALEEYVDSLGKMPVEEAAQKINALATVKLEADILDVLKKGCSVGKDFIDAISEYQTLVEAKQERITLLKLARQKITDNDYFTKAVDDIIAKMEATPLEYVVGKGMEKIWDGFMDSAWDLIVKGSPMEPILKAIDIEKMTLDVLFNSSDTASNNFKLLVMYIVDTYFNSALELSKDNYESTGTIPDAAAFVECYQAYIDYQIYGLEYTKTFIKDIVDSGPLHNLIEQIFFRESIESAEELKGVCEGQINRRKSCLKLLERLPRLYSNANGLTQLENILDEVKEGEIIAVESISFSKPEVVLDHMDDIFVVIADVYPANATNKKVRYTCSNPGVLEVSENGGFVTLRSPGTVTITAVAEDGGHTATQMITVREGKRLTEVDKGKCGENVNGENVDWVVYSDGTLYINGTGKMDWYSGTLTSSTSRPLNNCMDKIVSVIVGNGVTNIGAGALLHLDCLRKVVIPSSVAIIEFRAFEGCGSLQSMIIPEGVTSIEDSAFSNCRKLESVKIPEGVMRIGNRAFYHCDSLQSIEIPEGVTSIEDRTFEFCESLQSVTIPEGVTSIGDYAFQGCSSLESVIIPKGVTSIGNVAFSNCSSLQKIIMQGDAPSVSWLGYLEDNLVIYVPSEAKGYDVEPWTKYKIVKGTVPENYKKGDVNEDGEVNIKDLQIILRSVCEKIKLTDRQKTIADVTKDGKVDIHDLRKELRFVCGKIDEL